MRGTPAAIAALLLVAACGSEEPSDRTQPPPTTDSPAAESHPFTVGPPPEGYVARSAGRGTQEPMWGEDSFGTDEPYLVLSPDGTPDHPDVVVVSLTGYQGYQGGLDQAGTGDAEPIEVGGEDARFAPAVEPDDPVATETGARWADLVVAQGSADLAIRVASPDATLDELADVVPHVVVPDDRTQPPSVPDPPPGLEVVGVVDAHGAIADQAYVDQQSAGGPGPAAGYGVGWLRGGAEDDEHLAVVTLPERAAALDALVVGLRWEEERYGDTATVRRDGDVVLFERLHRAEDGGGADRSAWTVGRNGDLVVASAHGLDPVSLDELAEVARSVEPADTATWDAFVEEVRGGPGLHADPGRAELMRGDVGDGREWLLQDQPPGEGSMLISSDEPGWSVDPCLKLSDGQRECPSSEGGPIDTWVATAPGDQAGVPYVVVATRSPDAAALRVTTDGEVEVLPLVPVPGTAEQVAVVVGEGYEADVCREAPVTGTRIVQLADGAGDPLPCPP